ncbi:hypothetical protein SAMN05216412_101341 [Nitrosospira multiformis]|uniref:TubC N-terminal docking domain-containing protein n=1 Tax=Nitrosospira multiformis TaxID=1231 RepID=A0A1H9YQY7_9PROT|nr:hypothetical protein [Nitrosospira multiformis]SES71483.1 hypothetical protein SAMN05216412_101341 [Nitrosospira multiformis]
MNPALILEQIAADGLTLSVSESGNLYLDGKGSAVSDWPNVIRENKQALLAELRVRAGQASLEDQIKAGRKYAVLVDDASTDPVLVKVGIKGIGTFELAIPHAHYDGLALLEVIEQFSTDAQLERKAA